MGTSAQMREYTLSVDKYNQPKVLSGSDAVCVKLMELALLEKATYPTRPDMGLGIVSRYRYSSPDDLETLRSDYQSQIGTYLPELEMVKVTVTAADKNLHIAIVVDGIIYTLVFDSDTKTLVSL